MSGGPAVSGEPAGGTCPFEEAFVDRGAEVCVAGQPATHVWFVKRGALVLARGQPGADRVSAVRRSGSFVGLEALIGPTYVETARVTSPAILCGARLEVIDAWLGPPGAPARVALTQTLRAMYDVAPRAASPDGSAQQRVARWLLDEADRGRDPGVPRRYIADLLGIVPETLSRALARLAAAGAIAVTRRDVRIVDVEALRRAAEASSR
jgi:CRP-like cAMP-binding protein